MSKYFNNAIIGNSKILGCLNDKGELIRLYYPSIDYFQNIDQYKFALLRDRDVRWFDFATLKRQYYDGNILYTELDLDGQEILQRDYILPKKNILVRTLKFHRRSNLLLYSKLNSDVNKKVSGMVVSNALIQYCQDMYMTTVSNKEMTKYQINNSSLALLNGDFNQEDYIGMSEDAAILYSDINEITLYIAFENNLKDTLKTMDWCKKQEENLLYESTKKYWDTYLKKFEKSFLYDNITKIKEREIINRTILLFALYMNPETGATLATANVDEKFEKCGGYGYCWPRDAIFINKALNILGLKKYTDKFYSVWAPKAQLKSGLFEQRYFSNGELAPSWGMQIDETASILIGIYENKKYKELETVIVKAITGLLNFIDEDYISKECFDLWEERKGKHLYSTASIYDGLKCGRTMLEEINKDKYASIIKDINKTLTLMKEAILDKFVEGSYLKRSSDNADTDISALGVVIPYHIFEADDKLVENTVKRIENDLKTPSGGYMRYQWDNYVGGNAWIISSLWLALYYIELGNIPRAQELFDWVTNHADNLNFLPEQIDRNEHRTAWVQQLSWSHAMYILVKAKLVKHQNENKQK